MIFYIFFPAGPGKRNWSKPKSANVKRPKRCRFDLFPESQCETLKQAVINVLVYTRITMCENFLRVFRKQVCRSKWTIVFLTWWTWTRILSCLRCFSTWSKRVKPQWASSSLNPAMTSSWRGPSSLTNTGKYKSSEAFVLWSVCSLVCLCNRGAQQQWCWHLVY